ncbi:CHAT domain-containing protein, partial [Phyllosticta capitalensis]
FDTANSQGNFNEAIEIAMIAHDIVPPDHPDYIWWINNLCFKLCDRAEHNGSIEDFNRIVRITERALEELGSDLMPKGDLRRVSLLVNFGIWLNRRFDYTGATEDIIRSAERTTEALQMTSRDNPLVLVVLGRLANGVCVRIQRTGLSKHIALQFIDSILFDAETALKRFHSDNHTTTTMLIVTLSSLGNLLDCRFEQTGSPQDLDSALTYREAAVSLAYKLKHHLDSAAQTGTTCDSQIAVGNAEAGIQLACENEPQLAKLLGNLGACLAMRFECKNSKLDSTMADLHRAIEFSDTAVHFSLQDSDIRASLLLNLGNQLGVRYRHTRLQEDSDRRLKCYEQGWNCYNAAPSVRIRLAHTAATFLASQSRWDEASTFSDGAVGLLSAVSPRFLKTTDKQLMLRDWAGLATLSAAAALNAKKGAAHALELLELGRGVISSHLLETRSELTDLIQSHPELASEFEAIRDRIGSDMRAMTDRHELVSQHSEVLHKFRRHEMESRFQSAVKKIRSLDGFEDYLLPLTANEMKAAASSGPIVVVNVNEYRCDAFLISIDSIRLLPLPHLRHSDFEGKVRVSFDLLENLWEKIARPVLSELGFLHPIPGEQLPRMWWVLTGSLSRLPLHAAGRHATNSSETVLDKVISSYSTSIKALLFARQNSEKKVLNRALLVSMPETPSRGERVPGELKFANKEIDVSDKLLRPSMSTKKLKKPHKEDVLRSMEATTVFHFAGHGNPSLEDPGKSCLLLEDWVDNPLTVEDLMVLKLSKKSPWLAYLSACSTGESKIEHLQDEAIHLVSACQLAGFPHVVGSLWPIDDEYSAEAAREVYTTIIQEGWTDEAVALGVHNAAKLLR